MSLNFFAIDMLKEYIILTNILSFYFLFYWYENLQSILLYFLYNFLIDKF